MREKIAEIRSSPEVARKNKLIKKLSSTRKHKVFGKLVCIKDNQKRLDQVKKK